jgi:hypothetical protein
MEIPQQQAIDVLREWQRKKKVIQCGLRDSIGNNTSSYGCIAELTESSVRIDASTFSRSGSNIGIVIALPHASFSFGQWPEAPEEDKGDANFGYDEYLVLSFKNGSVCKLFTSKLL